MSKPKKKAVLRVYNKTKQFKLSEAKFLDLLTKSSSASNTIRELKYTVDLLSSQLDMQNTFEEVLEDSLRALPKVKRIYFPAVTSSNKPVMAADLMLSDFHAAEKVNKEALEGFNEYNFKIFSDRLWTLTVEVEKITSMFRHSYTVETLYIDLLGDLASGIIHDELLKSSDFPAIPAAVNISHILAQAIAYLARFYPKIVVSSVPGNHGRLFRRYEFKEPHNNFDWLITRIVQGLLKNQSNIQFNIPSAFSCIVEKEGWKFLLTHGDQFKGGSFGGIPYYTIERFRGKQMVRRHKQGGFDFLQIGDKHTPAGYAMNRILMNGSIIGDNEFSQGLSFESFPPSQKFFLISSKHGATFPVDIQLAETQESQFVSPV